MNTKITGEGWCVIEQDSVYGQQIIDKKKLDYDDFLIPIVCNNLRPGWIVMDCGAQYGEHSIAYSKVIGKDGAILAVESNRTAFECLSKNAEHFEAPIFCMHLALTDNHAGTAVHIVESQDFKVEHEVKTASIDGIARDACLDQLNFIKIDCDDAYQVLKGAVEALQKFKPVLLIEVNALALKLNDHEPKQIYDFLLKHDYEWRIVDPTKKGGDAVIDIMAWPALIQKPKLLKVERVPQ